MSDVYENKLPANTFVDSSVTDSEEDHDTEVDSECPSSENTMEDFLFPCDFIDDYLFDFNADLGCQIDDDLDGLDYDEWPQHDCLQHADRANELVLELFDDTLF